MNSQVNYPSEVETTGRFIVTFREGAQAEAINTLQSSTGLNQANLMRSAEFAKTGIDMEQLPPDGGAILENLGMAVVDVPPDAVASLGMAAGEESAILAVEPEGVKYALAAELRGLSLEYLHGFRDAAQNLYVLAAGAPAEVEEAAELEAERFLDSTTHTWGLQATKVEMSRFTGQGIKVAVLDTGLFMDHPDFIGRPVESKSFIPGVTSAHDGHGHGTHCTGTACGSFKPDVGPRYGVAYKSSIFIGKVLSDQGRGVDGGILAGIEWAIANQCHVISMSLGANVSTSTTFYETAGERALKAGSLIVAAAGNNAKRLNEDFGFVGRPANSKTFMAVGALDGNLRMGDFSARDTVRAAGTAVDIAAPGVAVYSSWPMPVRNRTISGTSMATPHVAGIAALWAQATGARGGALWQKVITNARTLPLPVTDVGRGLVQAP